MNASLTAHEEQANAATRLRLIGDFRTHSEPQGSKVLCVLARSLNTTDHEARLSDSEGAFPAASPCPTFRYVWTFHLVFGDLHCIAGVLNNLDRCIHLLVSSKPKLAGSMRLVVSSTANNGMPAFLWNGRNSLFLSHNINIAPTSRHRCTIRKMGRRSRLRERGLARNDAEETRCQALPPPGRRSRGDIDPISVDLALQGLNLSEAGTAQKATDRSRPGYSCSDVSHGEHSITGTPGTVDTLLLQGDIQGAISMIVAAGVQQEEKWKKSDATCAARDAVSKVRAGFTAVMTACAKRGLWWEAKQVIEHHMPAACIAPSGADWILAIDACAGPGGSEQIVLHLQDMRTRGFDLDRSVYSAAVRACARGREIGRAVFLMKAAAKRGMSVLPQNIAKVMRELTEQPGEWSQALVVFDEFLDLASGLAQARQTDESSGDGRRPALEAKGDQSVVLLEKKQLHLLSEVAPGWEVACQAALEACKAGAKWEKALDILNVLRAGGRGAELSREAYDEAIAVCGEGTAWDMVLLLVAEMRSDEIAVSPAAFEIALKACAATGSWSWSRSLLASMSGNAADGARIDARHYLDALRACAKVVAKPGSPQAQAAAKAALELVQDLREAQWLRGRLGEDAYVFAVRACAVAQDAWSALALLDSAHDEGIWQSTALRTAAMQACSGAGEWRAALSVLDQLLADGLSPGGEAYEAAMAACARGGVVDLALELLDRLLVERPDDKPTISAGYHGAIAACAECGHWVGATSLLQRMRQEARVDATTKAYNAAIVACCRAQQSVAALTLLGDMSSDGRRASDHGATADAGGVQPDETSYIWVMRAFGREGRWRTVMDLLRSMREEARLEPSVPAYNVVVEALDRAGEWRRALDVLDEMKREGLRPTEFTYTKCMAVCERQGQWEETLSLMSDMRTQDHLVPDSYAYSTAMMACSKAGRLDDVLHILQEMRDVPEGQGPNLVNYNIAIGSCARARDWKRMLEELSRMRWDDVEPEESTFLVPLKVCGHFNELPMALELLTLMHEYGVKPGVVSYGSAVAAACGAGDAASAARLLDEMDTTGHPPTDVTFAVAALACRDAGNADAALDLVARRRRNGLLPDPAVLSFAVQACARAGDLDTGLRLIRDVKNAGFVPDGSFYTSIIAGLSSTT